MGDRMTPVEAAKKLDIRPQQVYGFIKHGKVKTFPNQSGKAALVDLDDVKAVAGRVRHHREKDEAGRPKRREPKVKTGTIIDMHAFHKDAAKEINTPHKPKVVTGKVLNEAGDTTLIATSTGDGTRPMYWETEMLADRIAAGACHIESVESLFSVILFQWKVEGKDQEVDKLHSLITEFGLVVPDIQPLEA
jgi:hypothetical protein